MTSSFQQQSRIRKLTYFGLIAGLFTLTLLMKNHLLEPRAEALELREKSIGDVELTGSAMRLSLSGLRGVASCYLCISAIEKQKKHEWNKLELLIRSFIKLQPHYATPWLFQSWNLSYNVSVESDRVKDKYYYISRGIELLAEGERINRGHPDLRMYMGWYFQTKLGISDENETLRSLFQLSCIDPKERDPRQFRQRVGERTMVKLDKFQDFCQKHPFLIRRLAEKIDHGTPERIVKFLDDNRQVPSLYQEGPEVDGMPSSPMKPLEDRFPILPPESKFDPTEIKVDDPLTDDMNNYDVARAWYGYALDPWDHPGNKQPRKPRMITLIVVQRYPSGAQTARAESMQKEGWFDREGWLIEDWFPEDSSKRDGPKRTVRIGGDQRNWSGEAWEKAYEMDEDFGNRRGILEKTQDEINKMSKSDKDDYFFHRSVSNFEHFISRARVEMDNDAVLARKYFYKADQLRRAARRGEAIAMYRHPKAFGEPSTWITKPTGWKKFFLAPEHRNFRNDSFTVEEVCELQLKYLDLEEELPGGLGDQFRALVALQNLHGNVGVAWPLTSAPWMPAAISASGFHIPFQGPFDYLDASGPQYLTQEMKNHIRGRMDIASGRREAPVDAPRKR